MGMPLARDVALAGIHAFISHEHELGKRGSVPIQLSTHPDHLRKPPSRSNPAPGYMTLRNSNDKESYGWALGFQMLTAVPFSSMVSSLAVSGLTIFSMLSIVQLMDCRSFVPFLFHPAHVPEDNADNE